MSQRADVVTAGDDLLEGSSKPVRVVDFMPSTYYNVDQQR